MQFFSVAALSSIKDEVQFSIGTGTKLKFVKWDQWTNVFR